LLSDVLVRFSLVVFCIIYYFAFVPASDINCTLLWYDHYGAHTMCSLFTRFLAAHVVVVTAARGFFENRKVSLCCS